MREYSFDGPAYLGFDASHDVHGDGSLVVVSAAGHTPGSVVIFVALPSGRHLVLLGDLTWQLEDITPRVERPLLMRRLADSDPAGCAGDLARVVALAELVQLVPAHDARAYDGIPHLTPATVRPIP